MKLINGRGQIGSLFNSSEFDNIEDTLYHTWNFIDKTEETQKRLYHDFKAYVDGHPGEKIIFISTKSEDFNEYTKYKKLSEDYLSSVRSNYLIIRVPNIIGKGICERFRSLEKIQAYGKIELITLAEVFIGISQYIKEGRIGLLDIEGEIVSAHTVMSLIQFGFAKPN
jgi:hypothetical protein